MTYRVAPWFFSLKSISLLILFVFISLPVSVNAGVFSFVTNFFNFSNTTSVVASVENSQSMPLLKAALNFDPNPSKGGGDITIVGGTALLSETGPTGSLADVENKQTDQISLYVVREGDSLSQIAEIFGVSVNTIIWANDIKRGSIIHEGQTLVILPVSGVQHNVVKGDTIQSITKKYKGDLDEILQFNGLADDVVLAIGDIVTIPGGEIEAPKYSGSTQVVKGAGGPTYSGYYLRPIAGGRKSQGLHGYNGVDLAAPLGTPIFASASGVVIINKGYGWNGGYGKYVVIKHGNGTQTLYSHNSRNIVSVGQSVVKGQVIAYVGSTGRSTGAHVHFEIRGARNPF